MRRCWLIGCLMLLLCSEAAYSQTRKPQHPDSVIVVVTQAGDSICLIPETILPQRKIFTLDSIQDLIYQDTLNLNYIKIDTTKSLRHISNILAKNLFSAPKEEIDSTLQKVTKFNDFAGRKIDSIVIIRNNIFPEEEQGVKKGGRFYREKANKLNTIIKESTVKRYLIFKKGDPVVPENLVRSEAMLREMSSISKAQINLKEDENGRLIAYVETVDSWSIMAQLRYRYTNNGVLTISDYDFLGTGNRLDLNEYFNMRQRDYFKALELKYNMPNLFGKFIDVNLAIGYGKNFHSALVSADKLFVMPNDWAGGVRYNRRREDSSISYEDIFTTEDRQSINVWFGQSINISKRWGDNMYYAIKAEGTKFFSRPYHTPTYSPYYHNSNDLLLSVGFYKEKFYHGNLIYGYGRTESIPYGYKAEIVTGFRFGEYENAPYLGTNLSIGNRINIGYLSANIAMGTFIGNAKSLNMTRLNVGLLYFTKLQRFSKGLDFRQFLNINYTSGIRTMNGYNEMFGFENNNLLGSASRGAKGTTRLHINPETVFFTSMHVSGFKFAFFGFTDFGTIGHSVNPFNNKFYAVAGCGVRIRNESLIIKTIQFRVMIAVKGHRDYRNNLFYLNSEPPLRANRYIPMEPSILKIY